MEIIEFSGIQRSGNHALIKWIGNLFYEYKIDLEPVDVSFMDKKTKLMKIKGKPVGEFLYLNQYIPRGIDNDEMCLEYTNNVNPDIFIISYENTPIGFSKYGNFNHIYLLRSFRNNYASFCKMKGTKSSHKWIVDRWIEYAEYIVPRLNQEGTIYYDKWLVDSDYRYKISEMNNLPFCYDRTERNAAIFGDGSSFGGVGYNLRNEELLNRHKLYNFSDNQKEMIHNIYVKYPHLREYM